MKPSSIPLPLDNQLSSSLASVFAAKNFLQDLGIGKSGFAGRFNQAVLIGEAHFSVSEDYHKKIIVSVTALFGAGPDCDPVPSLG
jgi:hypothetical protein